ncbi:hypothetical protein GOP47_0012274 [Adiantum capillus-veneris]|uniref:Uncharacterized protein n=1 Tax=Adiantum capillus-veneris TaxID=13818 RepID=A0A9D4URR2_ADICA|nr:hypothetical protein GOP47_0012274 [Adiantum capillus-veneris]
MLTISLASLDRTCTSSRQSESLHSLAYYGTSITADRSVVVYAWKRPLTQAFVGSHCLSKPRFYVRRQPLLVIASSYGPGSKSSDGTSGDTKVQQMLVDMVRIQVGKVRMIEFVDERSQHLRNIADDVVLEYDRIAYRTMKDFDASGSRVLRQLDAGASAIEKDLMIARAEMEAHSRDFEEFQIRIAYSRNEGLFFKNLYKSPRGLRYQENLSKDQLEKKITIASSEKDLSSSYRQLLYGGLSLVMVSFLWSSTSAFMSGTCMRASKLASYGVIFSLLLAQLAYAKVIVGEQDDMGTGDD